MGFKYFLSGPTKIFSLKMKRRLSIEEFFLDWQKYPYAYRLLQVTFIYLFFFSLASCPFFCCWAMSPFSFLWFSKPAWACLFFFLLLGSNVNVAFYILYYILSFDFLGLGVPFFWAATLPFFFLRPRGGGCFFLNRRDFFLGHDFYIFNKFGWLLFFLWLFVIFLF